MHTFDLFGVGICTADKRELLSLLVRDIKHGRQNAVFTPNTQMLLAAKDNGEIKKLLNGSSINIPDGTGVRLAARGRGVRLGRMNGIDIAEDLLEIASNEQLSVFLLGGKNGVAERAAQNIKRKHPSLRICGTHHGYFDKSIHSRENSSVIRSINRSKPDILFVCFGFPLQENWIRKNISSLPSVKLAIGLGGSLDVWSGNIRRAPLWVQKAGLEWLWRTLREPKRVKRLAAIPKFLAAVIKEK